MRGERAGGYVVIDPGWRTGGLWMGERGEAFTTVCACRTLAVVGICLLDGSAKHHT